VPLTLENTELEPITSETVGNMELETLRTELGSEIGLKKLDSEPRGSTEESSLIAIGNMLELLGSSFAIDSGEDICPRKLAELISEAGRHNEESGSSRDAWGSKATRGFTGNPQFRAAKSFRTCVK
jgi:hypothetical protein